jgi:hypothetical protein
MKRKQNNEPELGRHLEYTLDLLASQLCTPERYGAVTLAEVIQFPDKYATTDEPLPAA